MGILDRLLGREDRQKNISQDEISRYELYMGAQGISFKKVRTFNENVDLEELEDAMPGWTYRLCSRSKRGCLRTIWNRSLPGPLPVENNVLDPIEQMNRAMEPMIRFGVSMGILQESIRAAFGWALPQGSRGGNPSTAPRYVGALPAILHPKAPELAMAWSPFVKNMTEEIASGIREGLAATKSEEKAGPEGDRRFERPSPDPEDYL